MEKTIKISKEAHNMLVKLGSKGESFDKVIKRLVQVSVERRGKAK